MQTSSSVTHQGVVSVPKPGDSLPETLLKKLLDEWEETSLLDSGVKQQEGQRDGGLAVVLGGVKEE